MLPNPNKKYKFKPIRRSSFIVDLKKLFTLLCGCCSIDTAGCAVSAPDKFGNSCESEWGSVATMVAGWSCTICRSAFFNGSIRFSGIIEYLLNSKVCRKKFEFVFQVGRKNVEPIAMSVTWKPSLVGVLFDFLFFCIYANCLGRNKGRTNNLHWNSSAWTFKG